MTPAISSAEIEMSARIPYRISAIDGGMSIASVPEMATTPPASLGS